MPAKHLFWWCWCSEALHPHLGCSTKQSDFLCLRKVPFRGTYTLPSAPRHRIRALLQQLWVLKRNSSSVSQTTLWEGMSDWWARRRDALWHGRDALGHPGAPAVFQESDDGSRSPRETGHGFLKYHQKIFWGAWKVPSIVTETSATVLLPVQSPRPHLVPLTRHGGGNDAP